MTSAVTIEYVTIEQDHGDDGEDIFTLQVDFGLVNDDSELKNGTSSVTIRTSLGSQYADAVTVGRKLNECYGELAKRLREWADDAELKYRPGYFQRPPRPRRPN